MEEPCLQVYSGRATNNPGNLNRAHPWADQWIRHPSSRAVGGLWIVVQMAIRVVEARIGVQ